eukprot:9494343-Pyramimonas_sp.AAC.2
MLSACSGNFFGWASLQTSSFFFTSSLDLPRRCKARSPLKHLLRMHLDPKHDCEDSWPKAMDVKHSSHAFRSSTASAPSSAVTTRLSTSSSTGSLLMALQLKSRGMVPDASTASRKANAPGALEPGGLEGPQEGSEEGMIPGARMGGPSCHGSHRAVLLT